jgi:PilZ domain-containing protein
MQSASVYKLALEKRLHRRIDISLAGRYMLANHQEYRCRTLDISVGGLSIRGYEKGNLGDRIILYIDEIGRIEGTIVRHIDKGFAISFSPSPAKRKRLLEKLTWLMNKDMIEGDETRRFTRHLPPVSETKFFLPDGRAYPCKIIDMSLCGASIEIDVIPAVGAEITLGKMKGRVTRHHDSGIAVEFTEVEDTTTIADHFGNRPISTVH